MTDGAARRVALATMAAGIVMGLAACGTTVAGAGSAAQGTAAQHGTPRPSGTQINPGGPMIPQAAVNRSDGPDPKKRRQRVHGRLP